MWVNPVPPPLSPPYPPSLTMCVPSPKQVLILIIVILLLPYLFDYVIDAVLHRVGIRSREVEGADGLAWAWLSTGGLALAWTAIDAVTVAHLVSHVWFMLLEGMHLVWPENLALRVSQGALPRARSLPVLTGGAGVATALGYLAVLGAAVALLPLHPVIVGVLLVPAIVPSVPFTLTDVLPVVASFTFVHSVSVACPPSPAPADPYPLLIAAAVSLICSLISWLIDASHLPIASLLVSAASVALNVGRSTVLLQQVWTVTIVIAWTVVSRTFNEDTFTT